jgi:hypothetical protein
MVTKESATGLNACRLAAADGLADAEGAPNQALAANTTAVPAASLNALVIRLR